jgi:hypothetical protein
MQIVCKPGGVELYMKQIAAVTEMAPDWTNGPGLGLRVGEGVGGPYVTDGFIVCPNCRKKAYKALRH